MMKQMYYFCLIAILALILTACKIRSLHVVSGSIITSDLDETSKASVSSIENYGNDPAIEVEYPPENIPKGMIVFREKPTEFDQSVLIRARVDIKNLQFFTIEYSEDRETEIKGKLLFTCDAMEEGSEIVIITSFPGDMPNRGLSFDLDGVHKAYTLSISGKDGSLILTPMGDVIVN